MIRKFLAFVAIFLFFAASPASAQRVGDDTAVGSSCAGTVTGAVRVSPDPTGNSAAAILVCNGTTWQPAGFQVGSDAASCTAAKVGTIRYTGASPPWEYCDGSAWVNFKQPRCTDDATGECYLDVTRSNDDPQFIASNINCGVNILGVIGTSGDTTPNAFNFIDQANVALSTLITSNIIPITGIDCPSALTISGDGSPQYRLCSDVSCSSVIQAWTDSSGTINNNDYLQLRLTSSASNDTTHVATINAGTESDNWNVTTEGSCVGGITEYTTPGTYTYTVPVGCTAALIEAYGAGGGADVPFVGTRAGGGGGGAVVERGGTLLAAGGGGGGGSNGDKGGGGGYGASTVTVSEGQTLNIWVGGGGVAKGTGFDSWAVGGAVNGGATQGASSTYGGGAGSMQFLSAAGGSTYGGGGATGQLSGAGGTSTYGGKGGKQDSGFGGSGYGDTVIDGADGSAGAAAANGGPGFGGVGANGGNGKVVITVPLGFVPPITQPAVCKFGLAGFIHPGWSW